MAKGDAAAPEPSQDTASFLRRLAGPSVTKAGLAKDQTEINRTIAEVSKGSKFYENEKRKDKELTERIAKILKIKDELVKEANIREFFRLEGLNTFDCPPEERIEMDADRLLDELEAQRDLSQTIVHVDMDAFYANVELLHNSDLEGKPFGVGSLRGVLSTASYEARKHGVRSGMAGFVAKKLCPDLIILPVDFEKYNAMSRRVIAIFKECDPTMIVAGCDEGFLNITKYINSRGISAEDCVKQMRQKVFEETNLTVSAGIAPNKMLAKICSDKNKPNGQYALPFERDAMMKFMRDLSIRKLPGVGRVHERLLDSIGIKTCGDIYKHRIVIWLMDHYFSKTFLYNAYLGIASNVVEPYQREERKSIGAERTFHSLKDYGKILEKLEEVAVELENEMRDNGWAGKTVTLKYKLDTFQVCTRAKSFNRWITKKDDLFNTGKELLKPELPLCIRLIGLRVTKLKDLCAPADQGIRRFFQPSIASDHRQHSERSPKKRKIDSSHATDEQVEGLQRLIEEEEEDGLRMSEVAYADEGLDSAFAAQFEEAESAQVAKESISPVKHPHSRQINQIGSTNERTPGPSPSPSPSPSPTTQSCPICAKQFNARDNHALNAHIDFCLSKDVIKQASASAVESASPGENKRSKPNSSSGRTVQVWDWREKQLENQKRTGLKRKAKR